MSPRIRPSFSEILSDIIWWALLSWLAVLIVGGMAVNYRNLSVSGLVPMLRSVGDGISILMKSYWPYTIGGSLVAGWVIARQRNP